jgi:hypothetical protein
MSGTSLTFSDSTTMTTSRPYGYDGGVGTWADAVWKEAVSFNTSSPGSNATAAGSSLAFGVTASAINPAGVVSTTAGFSFPTSGGTYTYTTGTGSWRGRTSAYSYVSTSGYSTVTYYVWVGDIYQRYA